MSMSLIYTLPDGSNDAPDEHGRHAATVNVVHSAKQYQRFPGCEQCRLITEMDAHAQHTVTSFGGWDGKDFTSEHEVATYTPGCAICERGQS